MHSKSTATGSERAGGRGLSRRRLLAAGATAGVIAAAGCLETRDGPVPEPIVGDDRIDEDWRLVDESEAMIFEEAFGPVTVQAFEHTHVHEYVDVTEAFVETFGTEGSPVLFFATRVDLRPAIDRLPGGVGLDRLMEEVRPAAEDGFRDQLEESGVEDVSLEETGSTTVDSGHTARTARFTARFPIEGETSLPDGSTEPVNDVVGIEAPLGIWHDDVDVIVSGGAYPTEPLSEVLSRSLSDAGDDVPVLEGAHGDALATEPETFAESVDALLRSVE
ncbi:hypothetical protein [Halorubrum vacuolatum]|uniref:Uncharacterized protein n=1 Tax=Halorubrum vacuolatum TaxID=63740 RepID=A0A238WCU4_HALVU|nr:hypothetical protein [Halorubrum vacuolatum]SNR44405.1 hypothetical protein SAMN06264855_10734 [Halorubrum vacuolatum]